MLIVIVVEEDVRRAIDVRTAHGVRHSSLRRHRVRLRYLWEGRHLIWYLRRTALTAFRFDVVNAYHVR